LNGDTKTASCIMQMDTGLDTGDVLKRTEVDISHRPMFLELHNQLAEIGAKDLLAVLSNIHDIKPVTQQSEYATYAHKINKEEGNIYASDMLEVVERKYRAFHLWPGLRINLANEEVKLCEVQFEFTNIEPNVPGSIIWGKRHFKIALSGGYLVPQVLQRPGKKQISVESFVNGMRQECKELEMLDCLNNGYKNI
jgi:methionyl-tRNA formyltransferase